jgi:hypothetical protein
MSRRSRRWTFCLLVAAAAAVTATGHTATGWPQAEEAFAHERYDDAARLLEAIVAADPADGLAHLRLASALLHLGRVDTAREHLDTAEKLRMAPGAVAYRRAALHAQTGALDAAFAALDSAVTAGLGPATHPETDALLAPLRADPRFAGFMQRYERAVFPCRHDPHYRELDFWVGTWDVRPAKAPPDSPAAENVITLEHGDCVVQEHWRSLAGGTGSSFNLYDASRRMWFQTWVDAGGELHEYRGNPDATGNMVLNGEVPGGPGQPARVTTRLTLFRQGADQVRQLSESTVDAGATWSTNYDFTYTRRAQSASATAPGRIPPGTLQ